MRRNILLAALALSVPAVVWKPRPARAADMAGLAAAASMLHPAESGAAPHGG